MIHSTTMKVLLPLVALIHCSAGMEHDEKVQRFDPEAELPPPPAYAPVTLPRIVCEYFETYDDLGFELTVTPEKQHEIERTEARFRSGEMRNIRPDLLQDIVDRLVKLRSGEDDSEELGGLDDGDDEELTLISDDDENPRKFPISKRAAMMCNLVKNIIQGDQTAKEIEIQKVTGPVLNLIVEYLQHHNGKVPADINKPIRDVKMEKLVEDPWDAEFINKQTKKVIFQIILGANYMDIKSLLHLGCAKIATLIKGKSPEEIKKILGDDDDASADNGDRKVDQRRLAEILGNF